ncbi:alginate export family protein [Shewanella sp.]|uniref:alginate export family protein n=1 Tax=Shewanella sp. TaxID=50422 RepID=UPI003A85AC7C
MKLKNISLCIAAILSTQFNTAIADPISEALIDDSKVNFQIRGRYETVDQLSDSQDLFSFRSRLTYQTGDIYNFFGLAELDDVRATNEKPWIADYSYTEINQSFLGYKVSNDTLLKYGRQRILLDNQRFVGGVGFRQNEQTYDAFSVKSQEIKNLTAFYSYVTNVNRIFSEESGKSDHRNSTNLVNVKYTPNNWANLSAYAYLIDNNDVERFSTDTYGVRLAGKGELDVLKLEYAFEYAKQKNGSNNPLSYDADYQLFESGIGYKEINLKLSYEILGSDDGSAGFITPLATLHSFQGWTDKFLFNGAGNWDKGIRDFYISMSGKFLGMQLLAVHHQFESDIDNIDMGNEWGVSLTYPFADYYSVSAKYASFSGADSGYSFSDDADKFWLTLEAKF